jgi:DNA repair protein RadC
MELLAACHSDDCDVEGENARSAIEGDEQALQQHFEGLVGIDSISLSASLIEHFGSLPALLQKCINVNPLPQILPNNAFRVLKNLSSAIRHVLRRDAYMGEVLSGNEALISYLFNDMAYLPRESFRVLFLNSRNRLLADEILWEGTVDKVHIYPREVLRRAIETNTSALIVAHNHPAGDPTPSAYDIEITKRLIDAVSPMDIKIHDHIIFSRHGYISMIAEGFM